MLSDTEGMIGGETYIKKGNGEAQKVSPPILFNEINLSNHRLRVHSLDMQSCSKAAKSVT
jgi:hypothetical protein